MRPKERLLRAISGEPVDRFPIAPRIWRYALSKGKSDLELARELDFELLSLGGGGLVTPFDDDDCSNVTPLLPEVSIDVKTRREGRKSYH